MALRRIISSGALALAFAACGGDGGNTTTANPSTASDGGTVAADAGSRGTGGPVGRADGGAVTGATDGGTSQPVVDDGPASDAGAQAFVAACEASCTKQAPCLGINPSACASECMNRANELVSDRCAEAATAETDCLKDLSCYDLGIYATAGRRSNATCGAAATRYFEACTVGMGDIPKACADLCARYDECKALGPGQTAASCEESCVLKATSVRASGGQSCADDYLSFVGCIAKTSCGDISAFAKAGTAPASCKADEDTLNNSCK